jgi:hypothetical protein
MAGRMIRRKNGVLELGQNRVNLGFQIRGLLEAGFGKFQLL